MLLGSIPDNEVLTAEAEPQHKGGGRPIREFWGGGGGVVGKHLKIWGMELSRKNWTF